MQRPLTHLATAVPIALLIAATAPQAQPPITFDVASVKPNTSGGIGQSTGMRGRTFTATNVALRQLILLAYDLSSEPNRLMGGPAWIGTDRFDVLASTPETAKPADRRQMVQALLAERFRLKVHPEMREMPIYELKAARTDGRLGPQLQPSAPVDCDAIAPARRGNNDLCTSFLDDGVIRGRARTMAMLAAMLRGSVDRRVVDRTGLGGNFDFEVKFAPEGSAAVSDPPSIYTALQEQLGLKLESSRGPVEVVVIDSVERPKPD
jgi:uncharacterized protein (TIGR03435 family)